MAPVQRAFAIQDVLFRFMGFGGKGEGGKGGNGFESDGEVEAVAGDRICQFGRDGGVFHWIYVEA